MGILTSSDYNRNLPLILIIHGYVGQLFPFNYLDIARNLKNTGKANVFTLDHSIMMTDSYFTSSTNARIVGEAVGELLSQLYFGKLKLR